MEKDWKSKNHKVTSPLYQRPSFATSSHGHGFVVTGPYLAFHLFEDVLGLQPVLETSHSMWENTFGEAFQGVKVIGNVSLKTDDMGFSWWQMTEKQLAVNFTNQSNLTNRNKFVSTGDLWYNQIIFQYIESTSNFLIFLMTYHWSLLSLISAWQTRKKALKL